MKKVILGCLIVFVLVGTAAGVGFYYFVYQPVGNYVGGLMQLGEVTALNEQIDNQAAYTAPDDDELSQRQVEGFMAVQEHIRSGMGVQFEEMKAKYQDLQQDVEQGSRQPDFGQIMAAFRDVMGLIPEAKRLQVEGLNAQGFSLEEYTWIRQEVYRAAGLAIPNMGLSDVVQAVQEGMDNPEAIQDRFEGDAEDAPARNRELVAPYTEQLREMAGLAWLGL